MELKLSTRSGRSGTRPSPEFKGSSTRTRSRRCSRVSGRLESSSTLREWHTLNPSLSLKPGPRGASFVHLSSRSFRRTADSDQPLCFAQLPNPFTLPYHPPQSPFESQSSVEARDESYYADASSAVSMGQSGMSLDFIASKSQVDGNDSSSDDEDFRQPQTRSRTSTPSKDVEETSGRRRQPSRASLAPQSPGRAVASQGSQEASTSAGIKRRRGDSGEFTPSSWADIEPRL